MFHFQLRFTAVYVSLTLFHVCGPTAASSMSAEPLARFVYPLAKSEQLRTPKFELDLSEVSGDEQLAAWGNCAKNLCEDWFPIMCRFLATDDWSPPETVRLVVKKELQAPGVTSGATISVSAKWVSAHPDDLGMVIHELTHVIQNYPPGRSPGWLVEGIADYIRYWKFEPEKPHSTINPAKASYRDGYGTSAAFLAWITWKYDKQLVPRLDAALRKQQYNETIFHDLTGKDLETLWQEFLAAQRR
jgi:hypothetical protein